MRGRVEKVGVVDGLKGQALTTEFAGRPFRGAIVNPLLTIHRAKIAG